MTTEERMEFDSIVEQCCSGQYKSINVASSSRAQALKAASDRLNGCHLSSGREGGFARWFAKNVGTYGMSRKPYVGA